MSKHNAYEDANFFERYRRMREGSTSPNELIEQPALRACLPPLDGLEILELGCGMGQLSRYLTRSGALSVTAVDSSEMMIEAARSEDEDPRIRYVIRPMENLDLRPATFDLVVSSLAIHYAGDHASLVENVSRWLKSGGNFVFSVEHPMKSAPKQRNIEWISRDGPDVFWPLSGYCEEGEREREWLAGTVVRYHRKVSTILNDVIRAGLTVDFIEEPATTPGGDYFEHHRERPAILIVKARKGAQD